jgi:guanosine-3',5'-bis(diphosphate) 3'-pyrophosphohydrolase
LALSDFSDENVIWIDACWDIANIDNKTHKVAISLLAQNKPGILAKISTAIASCDANIHNMVLGQASPDFHKLIMELELKDLPQLSDTLNSLKTNSSLSKVRRATYIEAKAFSNIDWDADDDKKSQKKKNK